MHVFNTGAEYIQFLSQNPSALISSLSSKLANIIEERLSQPPPALEEDLSQSPPVLEEHLSQIPSVTFAYSASGARSAEVEVKDAIDEEIITPSDSALIESIDLLSEVNTFIEEFFKNSIDELTLPEVNTMHIFLKSLNSDSDNVKDDAPTAGQMLLRTLFLNALQSIPEHLSITPETPIHYANKKFVSVKDYIELANKNEKSLEKAPFIKNILKHIENKTKENKLKSQ